MEWIYTCVPGGDPGGTPILSLIAKRTYDIVSGTCKVSSEQAPLATEDTMEDPENPLYSDVVAENDLIAYKPTTDVVVRACAYAPRGRQVYHCDCSVRVGSLSKIVRVYGNRRIESKIIRGLSFTDPEPFSEMPIGYSRAYGGMSVDERGTIRRYYPNPIGKGFYLKGGFEEVEALQVPGQEDPASPVQPDHLVVSKYEQWQECPKSASFGWTRRDTYPRYTYGGVLPEFLDSAMKSRDEMAKKNPQLANTSIPKMDFRVYQGASEGLWGEKLIGGEGVRMAYLDPDYPKFEFELPTERPVMYIDIGHGRNELTPELQTVFIDKESDTVSMVWRGAMVYGGLDELGTLTKFEYKAE